MPHAFSHREILMVHKKLVTMALCFLMMLVVVGCGKKRTFSIAVTDIVTDAGFVYADEEISPTSNRITVYSSESTGDAEIVLSPVEAKEETAYEPVLLKAGKSVTIDVEKGAWFKVGMRMTDAKKAGKKTLKIKGIKTRISSAIGGADGPTAIFIKGNDAAEDLSFEVYEIITEIQGENMILDGADGCFSVPIQNMASSPEPQVGDILEVVYDGRIEELYPSLFPGIYSLKVHKPVEMTAVIADIGTYNDHDALYFNPVEFSSLNNCIVTDWKKYIPTGVSFEAGDEIVITYTGNVEDDNPAVLSGVVKIALMDEGFKRKYGDFINDTYEPNSDGKACICIDGITYYDTGKETSMGARPVDDSIQIEYVEIPVGGAGASGTITAFVRIEERKTLACLIGEKWYLFESKSDLPGELNGPGEPNVSGGNAKAIREDVCALYLEVLEDLWNVDSGLNSEISQIGIDLSELSHLTEEEKDTVMSEFASKHNLPYIAGTFEELCEQGLIDKENLYWKDGLFFSIKTNEDAIKADSEGLEYTSFDAQKWRGGLGAYFFGQCTAQKNEDGTWSYTVGQEAIA